jgi:CheY-like chemotaxis protein
MTADPKPTVLLVDDDQDFLDIMRLNFENDGWEVTAVHSERAARETLGAMRPDLAVLDLMIDRMDTGFTLAHMIKRLDEAIPVLLVTGVTAETGMEFDKDGSRGEKDWIKADAVLAKPVRFEQIRRELDRLGVRHG